MSHLHYCGPLRERVDEAVAALMEPLIMGTLIGGPVVAMYLPIFKPGSVV